MKRIIFFFLLLFLSCLRSVGQGNPEKITYIVDSIPVIDDPEPGNEIIESELADIRVIRNKDTLTLLGYGTFDAVIYLFTKEYRSRPDSIKMIPSFRQMERKKGVCLFHNTPYTGKFIDYYYNGKKRGEGAFQNGHPEGNWTIYYRNGKAATERAYAGGIENGWEKQYFEDGSLQQKGVFVNGREDGLWEMYFPNGQVKQRSTYKNGTMEGEATTWYSTGKILAVEWTKDGKTTPDKRLEKIDNVLSKGNAAMKEEDFKAALKSYSKAIEMDSAYAEAYFSRGRAYLNDFRFDEAIADFTKALQFEPYYGKALVERAFARIRKHQFGGSRQLLKNSGVTVMASKDKPDMPENEKALICSDLKQGIFLGEKNKTIMEALSQFCEQKK
jgi:tetratricopeptide (TPR) repeat protein